MWSHFILFFFFTALWPESKTCVWPSKFETQKDLGFFALKFMLFNSTKVMVVVVGEWHILFLFRNKRFSLVGVHWNPPIQIAFGIWVTRRLEPKVYCHEQGVGYLVQGFCSLHYSCSDSNTSIRNNPNTV